ncbi:MAG: hypothetical protein WCT50_00080 [Patescibacteria group bacterium]
MNILNNPLFEPGPVSFLFWLAVVVVFFLIIRELILWYWKINENTQSLSRIADALEKIAIAQDFMAEDIDRRNGNKSVMKEVIEKDSNNIVIK